MYRIFISHSWAYSSQYDKVEEFLRQEGVKFYNHSVSCVIILAGVYASYSKWINIEIDLAKQYDKPIIAVEYWGAERTSQVVKNAATTIVKWNAKSVAQAVKDYAINQNS